MSYLKRKAWMGSLPPQVLLNCFSFWSEVLSVFFVWLETVLIICRDLCVRWFYPRSSAHTPNIREHFTLQVDADLLKTSQMWGSRGGCHMMTHRRLVFVCEWKVSSCCGGADLQGVKHMLHLLPTKQIVLTLCRLLQLTSLKCFWLFYVSSLFF